MDENNDVKQVPDSSTGTTAETVTQDVKQEEKVESTEEVSPKPATQGVPYERFREVNEKAKALEEELKKIKEESSVSPEKLAEQYPDWELMTESEKWMAKELIQLKEKARWEEDLAKAKKTFPSLETKESEFKDYCYKFPKSVDVEVLAKSFLFDSVKPEPEVVKEPSKGLEKPTGGSRQVPSPGMTLEDITRLRENQPKLYEKMIREGKIPKKLPEK